MLGFGDFYTFLAYVLLFASTIGCIVYGIINWNNGGEISVEEVEQEKKWLAEELEIDEEVSCGGES